MEFSVHESLLENKFLKDRLQLAVKGSIGKRRRPARYSPRPKLPEEFLRKAKELQLSELACPANKKAKSETCLDRIESGFEDCQNNSHQLESRRSAVLIQTWERRSHSENRKVAIQTRFGPGKENRPTYRNSMPHPISSERNDPRTIVNGYHALQNGLSDRHRTNGFSKPLSKSLSKSTGFISSAHHEEPEWISLSKKLCAKFVQTHLDIKNGEDGEHIIKETASRNQPHQRQQKPINTQNQISNSTPRNPKTWATPVTRKELIQPATNRTVLQHPPTRISDHKQNMNRSSSKQSDLPPWVDLSRKLCTKFIEEHIECETTLLQEPTKSSAVKSSEVYEKKADVRIIERIGKKEKDDSKTDVPEWINLSRKLRAKFIEGHKDDPDTISLDNQLNASDLEEYLSTEARDCHGRKADDFSKRVHERESPRKNNTARNESLREDKSETPSRYRSPTEIWKDEIERDFIRNRDPNETRTKTVRQPRDDDVNFELTFETFETEFEAKQRAELERQIMENNTRLAENQEQNSSKALEDDTVQYIEPDSLECPQTSGEQFQNGKMNLEKEKSNSTPQKLSESKLSKCDTEVISSSPNDRWSSMLEVDEIKVCRLVNGVQNQDLSSKQRNNESFIEYDDHQDDKSVKYSQPSNNRNEQTSDQFNDEYSKFTNQSNGQYEEYAKYSKLSNDEDEKQSKYSNRSNGSDEQQSKCFKQSNVSDEKQSEYYNQPNGSDEKQSKYYNHSNGSDEKQIKYYNQSNGSEEKQSKYYNQSNGSDEKQIKYYNQSNGSDEKQSEYYNQSNGQNEPCSKIEQPNFEDEHHQYSKVKQPISQGEQHSKIEQANGQVEYLKRSSSCDEEQLQTLHNDIKILESDQPKVCSKACNTEPLTPNIIIRNSNNKCSSTNGSMEESKLNASESNFGQHHNEKNANVSTNNIDCSLTEKERESLQRITCYFDAELIYEPKLPNMHEFSMEGNSLTASDSKGFIEVDKSFKCRVQVPSKEEYEHQKTCIQSNGRDANVVTIQTSSNGRKPNRFVVNYPIAEYANLPMTGPSSESRDNQKTVDSYVVSRKKGKTKELTMNKGNSAFKNNSDNDDNSYFPINPPHEFDAFDAPPTTSSRAVESSSDLTRFKELPRQSEVSDSDTPNSTPFDSRTLVSPSSCASDSDTSSWTLAKPNSYTVNPALDTDVSDCSMSVKCDYSCSNQSTLESRGSSHENLNAKVRPKENGKKKKSENRFSEVFVDCETSKSCKKPLSLDNLDQRYPSNGKSNFYVNLRDSYPKDEPKGTDSTKSMPESLKHLFNLPISPMYTPSAKTSMLLSRAAEPIPNHYYSTVPVMHSGPASKQAQFNGKPKKTERSSSLKIKDIAHGIILSFRKFHSHSKSSQISPSHYVDVSHLAETNGQKKACLDRFPSQDLLHANAPGYCDRRALSAGYFGDRCSSESNLFLPSSSKLCSYVEDADPSRPKSFNFGKITEAKLSKSHKKAAKDKKNKRHSSKSKSKKLEPKTISSVSRQIQQMADGTFYLVTTVSGDTAVPGVYSDSPDTASELSTHGPTKVSGESNC